MYAFILSFYFFSALFLFGFICTGVIRFGLQSSYSAYSALWGKAVPMNNMNLWSIMTFAAAFLICPVLVELGTASVFQFLGFLIPVYLIVVALTPDWETDKKQHIIHSVFAVLCLIGAWVWLIVVMDSLFLLIGVLVFIAAQALMSGTFRSSFVFWGEAHIFLTVYLAILLALV